MLRISSAPTASRHGVAPCGLTDPVSVVGSSSLAAARAARVCFGVAPLLDAVTVVGESEVCNDRWLVEMTCWELMIFSFDSGVGHQLFVLENLR